MTSPLGGKVGRRDPQAEQNEDSTHLNMLIASGNEKDIIKLLIWSF